MRTTPKNITQLQMNQIFVFGSNGEGKHLGGAARYAYEKFGAMMGQSEGIQGQSYGIDTMQGLIVMKNQIGQFIEFAENNPSLEFLVTEIGCGIAGYSVEEIAPLFSEAVEIENIHLPERFWNILNKGV